MLKALATLSAAMLLWAAAQPAWAQPCPGCGKSGPHSMHPRGHVLFGGELTPLPPVSPETDKRSPAPVPTARRVVPGKVAAAAPAAGDEHDPLALPQAAPVSARRQVAKEPPPRDSIGDPFSLVPPPTPTRTPQPAPVAPPPAGAEHTPEKDEHDLSQERPRFYYSGSQFPYYYGRSYVSYPHYDPWHQPTTDQCKNARKDRRHSWWTLPVSPEWVQAQHGLEPEQGPEMAAPRPGAAARRMISGLWQR